MVRQLRVRNKKRMKYLLMVILLLASIATISQTKSTNVEYFDQDWVATKNKSNAIYYRTTEKLNGKYLVKDFYKANDSLQMQATCSSVNPIVQDGYATWYRQNGIKEREGDYHKGNPVGLHKSYYESGKLCNEATYRGEKMLLRQYWSEDGTPFLTNGTGMVVEKGTNQMPVAYSQIRDSIMVFSYSVFSEQDTIYHVSEVIPTYTGGMPAFYRGLSKSLVYPRYSRRNNIEGKVFVQFVIDKKGAIRDIKVLKGIGGGCDEAAMEACLAQGSWIAGTTNGKPVKTRMVLPIQFKLR